MRPSRNAASSARRSAGPSRSTQSVTSCSRRRAVPESRLTIECGLEETKYIGRSTRPCSAIVARTGAHQWRVMRA